MRNLNFGPLRKLRLWLDKQFLSDLNFYIIRFQNPAFEEKIKALAIKHNQTPEQYISGLLSFGYHILNLTDENSRITIQNAKGYSKDQTVIVPNPRSF